MVAQRHGCDTPPRVSKVVELHNGLVPLRKTERNNMNSRDSVRKQDNDTETYKQ